MAAIGPLESFVFPGVFTRTLLENPTPSAAGDVRYPAIIGVGPEEIRTEAFEMIRGSSSIADNVIVGEDLQNNGQGNVFDSATATFQVEHYPMVTGDGNGTYTTNPADVIAELNGEKIAISSVDGATGQVTLTRLPDVADEVIINYFFKRRDTFIESEDLSVQGDGTNAIFKVTSPRIVRGDNSGISAVTSDIGGSATTESAGSVVTVPVIEVRVNGIQATITDLDGITGQFTLSAAPGSSDTVVVDYFFNEWQNTYDILPAASVSQVTRIGLDPSRADFVVGKDAVLANSNELHWGVSSSVEPTVSTVGSTVLGSNQISTTLTDQRLYKTEIATAIAGTETSFTLPYIPVKGDGLGTPLQDPINGTAVTYDDIQIYAGASLATATLKTVTKVEGTTVYLSAAPAAADNVYATFYANKLVNDTLTLENLSTLGDPNKYSITGALLGTIRQVEATGGSSTATYLDQATTSWDGVAGSVSNAFIAPSRSLSDETITLTVDGSGDFVVTSTNAAGTGSGATNTGSVGQTYVDSITGFTVSLATATVGTLTFDTKSIFDVVADVERGIPGLRVIVTDLTGVETSDTATITTINMNTADEPKVGDVYYVTFDQAKTSFNVGYFTRISDVTREYGPISQNNPISIAANLAFLNGARAIAIRQIPKETGEPDATVASYIEGIDEFNEPLSNGTRPVLIQPLTTNFQVINYLKTSNAKQTSIRYRNERTSYFGFAPGTTPSEVIARNKALNTELLTGLYPDGGVITITNEFGSEIEILVGGEMVAIAMAGRDANPTEDVATPLTNAQLIGFVRLARNLDNVTANQIGQAGTTVLEFRAGVTRVMMALTTNLTSVLTRDPRIVEVKHFVQKGTRTTLDPFIGRKNLPGITSQVEQTLSGYFQALKSAKIIADFKGIRAFPNAQDPSTIDVEVFYSPVLPVNWIMVTFNLSSVLS